ncbi:hypothetical protein HYPSUDRAFT_39228 [Hypholoma sublateritium FD-334 SS-4]|uniref:Uncharacterized protein n=1 Tax=Hypholoma sublateritium (strain FD-334 SS-4) TaxID=945553 RepID=A0A0D2MK63_HYPSF|nr:hypothetical protein HYPSUDRAFT_39228 [Hypholoma sublateritium FD-334 SS-4]
MSHRAHVRPTGYVARASHKRGSALGTRAHARTHTRRAWEGAAGGTRARVVCACLGLRVRGTRTRPRTLVPAAGATRATLALAPAHSRGGDPTRTVVIARLGAQNRTPTKALAQHRRRASFR